MQFLKKHEQTRAEKRALLKETMDLYSELMSQHSKSSSERDNPQGTYEHFNNKWRVQDAAFKDLFVLKHLICPIYQQDFVDPVLLMDDRSYEQYAIDAFQDKFLLKEPAGKMPAAKMVKMNDALKNICNAQKAGKRQVILRPVSSLLIKFIRVMHKHGYINEFERGNGKIIVNLIER